MTVPLDPPKNSPAQNGKRFPLRPGDFRPLDPGFLEWVSRKNAPPARPLLYLPVPTDLQVDDEIKLPRTPSRRR